ncbi:voltage-gated potassium channel [Xylariaceae sp. FL0594]|nr:voltage-gated potassium channel [Xylariaceae sp. FL0594]
MDDANLNEDIANHTEVVDRFHDQDGHGQEVHHLAEGEELHLRPTRWYFASAVFPMVAGTLGPVASAFSICALVNHWRQHVPPGADLTTAEFVDDPAWLLAVNAVQLVIAVVANAALLLNMTRRLPFSIAQPITIVGWYVSSFLLIALCATASGPLLLQPEAEYVWAQAFYYGIFAAILYFIVASLMVVTVWGAYTGHYDKDFELTTSQRTLMLQSILFLVYLLVGALVFSHVEGWLYLDAVYWADYTLFTVGFGDLKLQTNIGRGLMIPYALVGIATLGLVIGSIRSLMLDRGKSRIDARILEKRRRRYVRRLSRSNDEKLLGPIMGNAPTTSQESTADQSELERRHAEFRLMRKIQGQASKRRRWTALGVSTSSWLVLWLVGAKVFQQCEAPYQNWTYFNGIYFSFQAMSTVGYGDLTPISNPGKAFFVFWSLLALPTLTVLISNAGDTVIKLLRDATLLLGNITILPGESGFKSDIKRVISKLSFGALFTEEAIQESPPGFLGASQPHQDEDDEEDEEGGEADEERRRDAERQTKKPERSSTGRSISFFEASPHPRHTSARARSASNSDNVRNQRSQSKRKSKSRSRSRSREPSRERELIPQELPKSAAEYHLVLIDEIRRVSQHLQHTPPREYSYREWAWYLRLIGEDESDVSTHRPPDPHPHTHTRIPEPAANTDEDGNEKGDRPKWSWVGHRSPLMDTRQEAEWILDKLTQRLRQELRKNVGGEGAVRDAERREDGHHDRDQAVRVGN